MSRALDQLSGATVGIAGYGHLGSSIARGLLRGGFPKERILISSAGSEASRSRAERDGLSDRMTDTASLAMRSDVMMVIARPQDLPSFVGIERAEGSFAISFMAGVSLATVRRVFGHETVRAMTTDPETNDEGHGGAATWEPDERAEAILRAAGLDVRRVSSEEELDAVCVGICLPMVLLHIPRPKDEITAEFAAMRAKYPMYEAIEKLTWHVAATRVPHGLDRVATKGGVTEVIAQTLKRGASLAEAVDAGLEKCRSLGREEEARV